MMQWAARLRALGVGPCHLSIAALVGALPSFLRLDLLRIDQGLPGWCVTLNFEAYTSTWCSSILVGR